MMVSRHGRRELGHGGFQDRQQGSNVPGQETERADVTRPFTNDFLWGAATAAYQIEGAVGEDGRGPSIWDVFCHTPGKTVAGDTGDVACDHYHRWRDDIALMQALHLNAYRFSIAWPRVLPQGRGPVNAAGLDFYERLVDGLLQAGIEPFVTLYHWDLPAALQMELGGWVHDDLPRIFAEYAKVVFDRLADRVRYWVTINEPWCVVDGGYFHGVHAPGIRDRRLGYLAGHNLMRAHAYASAVYHAEHADKGRIGFALNTSYSFPASDSAEDVAAADRAMLNFGGWFGDPACRGDYPPLLRERLGDLLPAFSTEDQRLLRESSDFLALNYYTSDLVRHAPGHGEMEVELLPQTDRPHTETNWPVVPEGFYEVLKWLDGRYPGLPIYVAENGAALIDEVADDGSVDDQHRIAYLREHLLAAERALREGVDLRGYFVWTLMDNLEWACGFEKRFGLVRCDHATQRRIIKASGHWYAEVIRTGGSLLADERPFVQTPDRG